MQVKICCPNWRSSNAASPSHSRIISRCHVCMQSSRGSCGRENYVTQSTRTIIQNWQGLSRPSYPFRQKRLDGSPVLDVIPSALRHDDLDGPRGSSVSLGLLSLIWWPSSLRLPGSSSPLGLLGLLETPSLNGPLGPRPCVLSGLIGYIKSVAATPHY